MTPPKRSFFQKVTHRLGSNFYQINGMLRTLTGPEKLRFLFLSLRHAKSVVKTDRLLSVDEQMAPFLTTLHFTLDNEKITLPMKQIEAVMNHLGNDIASLEMTRELFGNNEYLRAFKKNIPRNVVFDVGSNRGFFVPLAAKLLKSERIICIEPQEGLQPARHAIANANDIPLSSLKEYHKFCSSKDTATTISINRIMKDNQIDQIDFMKMNIEGGEADIFSGNLEWLDRCKNITMEIHYALADVGFIPSLLRSRGFKCVLTDLRGRPISEENTRFLPRGCAYLYASADRSLIGRIV